MHATLASPLPAARRHRRVDPVGALGHRSSLAGMIGAMVSSNTLAAFTADISRNAGIAPAPAPRERPVPVAARGEGGQRALEAVPSQPAKALPRGSLLDLRV